MDEADGDDDVEKRSALSNSSQTLSRTSSYETARAEPSPSFWESHRWDVPARRTASLQRPHRHRSKVHICHKWTWLLVIENRLEGWMAAVRLDQSRLGFER
jgi:hypothetical protein